MQVREGAAGATGAEDIKEVLKARPPELPEGHEARAMADLIPHMDAVYNLARWLVRNGSDAEDLAQEAYLRALRSIHTLRGRDSRPWLLAIVRNACFDWMRWSSSSPVQQVSQEEIEGVETKAPSAETILLENREAAAVREAVNNLPVHLREVLNLRELEELSYRQIAEITQVPMGTVMSRLSRARQQLASTLRMQRDAAVPTT